MQIQAKLYNFCFSHYTVNELEGMAKKGERLILTEKEIKEVEAEREALVESCANGRGDVTPNSYNKRLIHIQKLYESAIRFPEDYQRCININGACAFQAQEKVRFKGNKNTRDSVNYNHAGLSLCGFFSAAVTVGVTAAVVLSGASTATAPKK